ncbi:protoporphyrinogen oxidase HemJ [Teredinibacter sp. KSP-S5-2]|uniref:protoporphyrinogen oxidase HemJ n=1 Tax=Teredinibacter sp. KSP-S5-2 TaxID=3034506 RepID=UPI00293485C3|nr:protoporphyrinogen oxidase HemJ [Teredinibacter sp. KSP-S5-2]WNO09602.1 protoporphyrinogen oxidase HemJ [Teredinibacter sp. KSP-S5-2]
MLWAKAFHIIAVVSWFAMLFYLPRLFVYHAMTETTDTQGRERFKVMEYKLYKYIGTPAMIATLILGFGTAAFSWEYYSSSTWFWLKIVLVILLVIYHHLCGYHVKLFRDDDNVKNHVYFRWFNEFPTILLIAVTLLVVLKRPL